MECSCEICICLPICRNRVVKINHDKECLVIELLENCPLIVDYFKKAKISKHSKHAFSNIFAVCKCMNIKDNYFIWHADTVREIN